MKTEMKIKACKNKDLINKFYDTSAGMLFGIRPCGIVACFEEMYTSESLTQLFLLIRKHFYSSDGKVNNLKYVGYDRACEFKPFLNGISKKDVVGAQCLLDQVEFLVDIFHVAKHTKLCCMPLKNNPLCEYHPALEKFKKIHGVNTESCEQANKKLNKYKYITRKLTRFKRKMFFMLVIDDHNVRLLQKNMQRK